MDAAGGVLSGTEVIDGGTLTTTFTETFGPAASVTETLTTAEGVIDGIEATLNATEAGLVAEAAANLGVSAEKASRMATLMAEHPALNTAANKVMSTKYAASEFVYNRPYLSTPFNWVAGGWRAVVSRVRRVATAIGPKAALGYTVAILSSETGRRRICKSAEFTYRQIMRVRNTLVRGLRHLWWPGNVVANGLQWSYDKELDFFRWVGTKYSDHLADRLSVTQPYMQIARLSGLALGSITMTRTLLASHPIIGGAVVLFNLANFVYGVGMVAARQGWLGTKIQGSQYLFETEADERTTEHLDMLAGIAKRDAKANKVKYVKLTRDQKVIAYHDTRLEVERQMRDERQAKAEQVAKADAQAKAEKAQADQIRNASAAKADEDKVHTVTTLPSGSVVGSSNTQQR
jgi:hypothetical protein